MLVQDRRTGELAVAKHATAPMDDDARGREALALPRISNPHVVRYRGLYYAAHPDIPGQAQLCTVTDFVPGDSLATLLRTPASERSIPFDEPTLWEILAQLQDAVTANERAGVVHADLHPGNIIITPLEGGRFHVTAIDYGVSKVIDRATLLHVTRHAPARTAFHTPPELMSPDASAEYRFVRGTDRHFVGTTLLELMIGGAIPERMTPQELLAHLRGQVNTPWSHALFDAIARLIAEQPAERLWPVRLRAQAGAMTITELPATEDGALPQKLAVAHGRIAQLSAALVAHGIAIPAAFHPTDLATAEEALIFWMRVQQATAIPELRNTEIRYVAGTAIGIMATLTMHFTGAAWLSGIENGRYASLLLTCIAGLLSLFSGAVAVETRGTRKQLRDAHRPDEGVYCDYTHYALNPKLGTRVYPAGSLASVQRRLADNPQSSVADTHFFFNGIRMLKVGNVESVKHWFTRTFSCQLTLEFPGDNGTSVMCLQDTFLHRLQFARDTLLAAEESGQPLMMHAVLTTSSKEKQICIHDPILGPAITLADLEKAITGT